MASFLLASSRCCLRVFSRRALRINTVEPTMHLKRSALRAHACPCLPYFKTGLGPAGSRILVFEDRRQSRGLRVWHRRRRPDQLAERVCSLIKSLVEKWHRNSSTRSADSIPFLKNLGDHASVGTAACAPVVISSGPPRHLLILPSTRRFYFFPHFVSRVSPIVPPEIVSPSTGLPRKMILVSSLYPFGPNRFQALHGASIRHSLKVLAVLVKVCLGSPSAKQGTVAPSNNIHAVYTVECRAITASHKV